MLENQIVGKMQIFIIAGQFSNLLYVSLQLF